MATLCPVCKFPIERNEQPGYIGEPFCSEFCAVATPEQKAAWQVGLPEGGFVLYPCSESGCAIEDAFSKDSVGCCSSCSDKRKARVRGELLTQALPFLSEYLGIEKGEDLTKLVGDVRKELKR